MNAVRARTTSRDPALRVLRGSVAWLTTQDVAEQLGVPLETARDYLLALLA
jgi:hypothetical protein